MYCDANAKAKNLGVNKRATDIAQACGYKDLIVLGDAFISRYYDNESSGAEQIDDWVRRSITVDEVSPVSQWVVQSAAANAGKSMGSYTRSVLYN